MRRLLVTNLPTAALRLLAPVVGSIMSTEIGLPEINAQQGGKAGVGEQFEAMRALNEADLQFTAAQENLIAHRAEHASHDGKDK
jgi:hypothetical protein